MHIRVDNCVPQHFPNICRCQCLACQSTVAIYWALEGRPSIDTIAPIEHSRITHWHYQALCTFSLPTFTVVKWIYHTLSSYHIHCTMHTLRLHDKAIKHCVHFLRRLIWLSNRSATQQLFLDHIYICKNWFCASIWFLRRTDFASCNASLLSEF